MSSALLHNYSELYNKISKYFALKRGFTIKFTVLDFIGSVAVSQLYIIEF